MKNNGNERFQRIDQILNRALELPPAQRPSFLDEACGDDLDLRRKVETLLIEDENTESHSFMEKPIGAVASDIVEKALGPADGANKASQEIGREIGSYRIVQEIGRGGMGTVYLATDDRYPNRQVALKLIQPGKTTKESLTRFRHEQQILAALQHSNIARLLDGGETKDGLPYFVMEYVEGVPITDYCDSRELSINQRLTLFRFVCQGVQYAHQNLVVHRDLKPSNILVTEEGKVKLLDFGIAKLLDNKNVGWEAPNTKMGFQPRTPEYAAPEQIRGETVTTVTDVYQLGVVLNQLLTGHPPYRIKSREPHDIEHVILNEPALVPSEQVEKDTEAAQRRGTSIKSLRRQLSSDLDTITLKALRKDPTRRYESVEQFSEDIRRYLKRLPIIARPESLIYRATRFVQRHRFGVGVTLAFMVVVAVFVSQIIEQRDNAQAEAEKANVVSDLLVDLFDMSDPFSTDNVRGDTMRVRDFLEKGVERIEHLDQQEIQAQMRDVIGRIYRNVGNLDSAESMIRQSLDQRRSIFGAKSIEVASSLNTLAGLLSTKLDYDGAEYAYREALEIQKNLVGENSLGAARIMGNLGQVLHDKADFEQAEFFFRRAYEIHHGLRDKDSLDIAQAAANLGKFLIIRGDFEEAARLMRKGLEIRQRLLGEHPSVSISLYNLAIMLLERANCEEAEPLLRQALEMDKKLLGEEHQNVIVSQGGLAEALACIGDIDAAKTLFRQTIEMAKRNLGEHDITSRNMTFFANLLRDEGEFEEAESLYRQALAIDRSLFGEHTFIAYDLSSLARLLQQKGELDEAERLFRQSIEMDKAFLGDEYPLLSSVFTLYSLGLLLLDKGEYREAEQNLQEAHAYFEQLYGTNDETTQEALQNLIRLYDDWGKPDEAAKYKAMRRE